MRITFSVLVFVGSLFLVGCGHEISTDDLIEDLDSADAADRINATRLLQNRNADAAKVIPALIKSLSDVDGDVRRSAAIGLGYYGAQAREAIPALEEKQKDPDARVREAAKVAISRIANGKSD